MKVRYLIPLLALCGTTHASLIGTTVNATSPFTPSSAVVSNAGSPEFTYGAITADFMEESDTSFIRFSGLTSADTFSVTFSNLNWGATPGAVTGAFADTTYAFEQAEVDFDPAICGADPTCFLAITQAQQDAKDRATATAAGMSISTTATSVAIDYACVDSSSCEAFYPIDVVLEVMHVPLPPTVWLFGSSLLGLIAMKRRRSTS